MKYFMKVCDFADEQALWINDLRLSKITFVNEKPPGAAGAFVTATLAVYYEPDSDAREFSSIIRGLRHAWQCKSMGKVKYFLYKAFRRKKLEADAQHWEGVARFWFLEKEVER